MKISIISILILSLILFSCKEDEPTAPQEELPTEEPLVEATIGPEGGSLDYENFKLNIPPGSFTSNASLKLYQVPDTNNYYNSISQSYSVSGLPNDFQSPVYVSIKHDGNITNIPYIIYERSGNVELIDTLSQIMDREIYETQDSAGFVSCYINSSENSKVLGKINSVSETELIYVDLFRAVDGRAKASEHFEIIMSDFDLEKYSTEFENLMNYCEEAYDRFEQIGFNYDDDQFKLDIYEGNLNTAYMRDHMGLICINTDKSLNFSTDDFRTSIEWAFVYTFLSSYQFLEEHSWVIGSWGYWSSLKFNHWPNIIHIFSIMDEAFKGKTTEIYTIGSEKYFSRHFMWSISFLLDYLVSDNFDETVLSKIIEDVKNQENPISAIMNRTGSPHSWLFPFYKDLITNEKYSTLLGDYWLSNAASNFEIDNLFTEKIITHSFNDLSGKWYNIELSDNIPVDKNLIIESGADNFDHVYISVFSFEGNNIEFLGDAESQIEIEDIKSYADEGKGFLILITNAHAISPYKNKTEITTEFKFNDTTIPEYSRIYFEIKDIELVIQTIHPDGFVDNDTKTAIGNAEGYLYDLTSITIGENTLDAVWDMEIPNAWAPQYNATLKVEFSPDRNKIVKLTYSGHRAEPDGSNTSQVDIALINIPYNSNNWYRVEKGENPCASISSISDNGKIIWRDGTQTTSKVAGWSCTEDSYIDIYFYK